MFKVSFNARFILKELMVHLYDDIIWLQLPESFSLLFILKLGLLFYKS